MDTFYQLEFDKIKNQISSECQSELGRAIAVKLHPLKNKNTIEKKLNLTKELQDLLVEKKSYNFGNISKLDELLINFKHDTYNFAEFRQICFNVIASNNIEQNFDDAEKFSDYLKLIRQIIQLPELTVRFSEIFSAEGEVKDSASKQLLTIRRRKVRLRKNIISELNSKIQNLKSRKFVYDEIVTQRNGRYVIPIKEGAVHFVKGITHGHSKSSVFLEPAEVVAGNNELDLLLNEEKREIFRIFKVFSDEIKYRKDDILLNTKILQKLDYYFAVARFANNLRCTIPEILQKPHLKLIEARHPLLILAFKNWEKVIPFDLELGKNFRLLIISGPNTGGKTITLKTVGLLTLMALSGLPIPVKEGSEVGIFEQVFADIGDHQSIENALSTFSSHIKKIKEMVQNGDEKTLVLIDEIGAATDPEQGSALAQSILERIAQNSIMGVITTHYTALKLFAENDENCVNAAMQFDHQKHLPTYKFNLGLPGNSFAIEVASQLGMDVELINRARKLAGRQSIELTEILRKMSEEKKELARQNHQFKLKSALLKQKIKDYENKIKFQENETKEIKKKSIKEARDFLTTLQKKLNAEISEIKKQDKKSFQKSFQKVVEKNKEFAEIEGKLNDSTRKSLKKIRVGQTAWLADFETEVVVVDIAKNSVKVDMNGITFATSKEKLYETIKRKKREKIKTVLMPQNSAKLELKLLGNTFDEALPKLQKFIDNAILSGQNMGRIVHGKGSGILKQKVRTYLRTDKNIVDFFSPPPEAGGDGVTVILFTK